MNLVFFLRKILYYTALVLIIQTNLFADTYNQKKIDIRQENNQTKFIREDFTTKSSMTLESLNLYGQAILVIFSSFLGMFFLRDKFE